MFEGLELATHNHPVTRVQAATRLNHYATGSEMLEKFWSKTCLLSNTLHASLIGE